MRLRRVGLLLLLVAGVAARVVPAVSARAHTGCALYAAPAPSGADTSDGSQAHPFATVGKLLSSLRPGQTGCLLPRSVFTEHVVVGVGGGPTAPIRLNGQGAALRGGVEFTQSSHDVILSRLAIQSAPGFDYPAMVVLSGYHNQLVTNGFTGNLQEKAVSCISVVHANRSVVDHNSFAHCTASPSGAVTAPAIAVAVSNHLQLTNNVVQDEAGDAVALTPNAQYTLVERNYLVNNLSGILIGGDAKTASNGNHVLHNSVAWSKTVNVHADFPGPVGRGNVVADNCIFHAGHDNLVSPRGGFSTSGNVAANPASKSCAANKPSAKAVVEAPAPARQAPQAPAKLKGRMNPVVADVQAAGTLTSSYIELKRFSVVGIAPGAVVHVTCTRGCAVSEHVAASAAGVAATHALVGKRIPAGAVIQVFVTKPQWTGYYVRLLVAPNPASGSMWKGAESCLDSTGPARPVACAKAR